MGIKGKLMSEEFSELRQQVYDITLKLCDADLIRLSAGNISARSESGHVAITPAGLLYDDMVPEDIVVVDLAGTVVDGARRPSSETPMHTAIYRSMPEVGGVVHAHSVHAIAFASLGMALPVVCIELLAVGGPVPVSPYVCPGTARNGEVAVEIFQSRPGLKSLLMRNHGMVAIGPDLGTAYQNAVKTETGAEIYKVALQVGKPEPMTEEQIDEIYRVYRRARSNE